MSDETSTEVTAPADPQIGDRNKWQSQKWHGFALIFVGAIALTVWGKMPADVFAWLVAGVYATFCGANVIQKKIIGS